MRKSALRKKYKDLRQTLSTADIDDLSIAIANNLLSLDIWQKEFYHVFLPIEEQKEVNTEFVLSILSGKDKNTIVSKSDFKTLSMTHFLLTDSTRIRKNKYHIPEPTNGIEMASNTIDVVFVPLLAFDNQGHRVGYGKGFYDKFLTDCRKDTIKIGLSFFGAEAYIEDVFERDIPLDYCITPTQNYSFGSKIID